MNRRAFFGLITGVLGALGFKAKDDAKLIVLEPCKPVVTNPEASAAVRWGPGVKHPHWRVPQGRWTFVEDK